MEDKRFKNYEMPAKITRGPFDTKPEDDGLTKYEQEILDAAKGGKLVWIVRDIGEIGCIVYVGDPNGERNMLPATPDNPSDNEMFGKAFDRLVSTKRLTNTSGRFHKSQD